MTALRAAPEECEPLVNELAANDRHWFADHPSRSFRARPAANGGTWLVRRRTQGADADVMLRTVAAPGIAVRDDDLAIGAAWYANAFGLEKLPALKAARKLLRSQKPRGAR